MSDYDGTYDKDGRVRRGRDADPRDDRPQRDAGVPNRDEAGPPREPEPVPLAPEPPIIPAMPVPEVPTFDDLQPAVPPPPPKSWEPGRFTDDENPFASPSLDASSPYTPSGYQPSLPPHRGGLILALGLLGIFSPVLNCCCPLPMGLIGLAASIPALLMAQADLRAMDAGRMDPSGRGLAHAGIVLAVIAIGLNVLGVLGLVAFLFFAMVA